MSATSPLLEKLQVKAGDAEIRLVPMEGKGAYLVEIAFPLDSSRLYLSKFANPMRCALEAAEEALNELRCSVYNAELNADGPMMKPGVPRET